MSKHKRPLPLVAAEFGAPYPPLCPGQSAGAHVGFDLSADRPPTASENVGHRRSALGRHGSRGLGSLAAGVDGLTDESLAAHTEPVDGIGWPSPSSFPVRKRLLIVLNEEWHYRLSAGRDLDALNG